MSDACPMCGGRSREETKYVSMCGKHQAETNEADARRAGIPDLIYTQEQLCADPATIAEIRFKFSQKPGQYLLIKVLP